MTTSTLPAAAYSPAIPTARLAAWLRIQPASRLRILRDDMRLPTATRAAAAAELARQGESTTRRVWGGGW